MQNLEKDIKEYLLNKKLTHIDFFNLGESYLSPDPEHTWILKGGIEFEFEKEYFSFGWNDEKEFYDILKGQAGELAGDLTINHLDAKNIEGINSLIGQIISDVSFKWNFYQEYDEDFELIEEKKYMPYEVMLHFENHSILQLSAIKFRVNNNEIKNYEYDSINDFLISLNKPIEINEPVEEEF